MEPEGKLFIHSLLPPVPIQSQNNPVHDLPSQLLTFWRRIFFKF